MKTNEKGLTKPKSLMTN